jgi:hypothetical protein
MKTRFEKDGGYYAMNNTDLLHTRILQYRAKRRQLEDERALKLKNARAASRDRVKKTYQDKLSQLEERYRKFCTVALDEMTLTINRKREALNRAELAVCAIRQQLSGVLDMDEKNLRYDVAQRLRAESKRQKKTPDEVMKDKRLFYKIITAGHLNRVQYYNAVCGVLDDFESIL